MFSVEKLSYYVDSHEDRCDIKGIPYTFDFRLQFLVESCVLPVDINDKQTKDIQICVNDKQTIVESV